MCGRLATRSRVHSEHELTDVAVTNSTMTVETALPTETPLLLNKYNNYFDYLRILVNIEMVQRRTSS